MVIVEELGVKEWITDSGRKESKTFCLFECPVCGSHVEKIKYKGLRSNTCGLQVCKQVASKPKASKSLRDVDKANMSNEANTSIESHDTLG